MPLEQLPSAVKVSWLIVSFGGGAQLHVTSAEFAGPVKVNEPVEPFVQVELGTKMVTGTD